MTIILYQNLSETHRVNKILINSKEYSGTLRDSCSIINPSFVIESSDNLSEYNYCYIPNFNRYYFINDVTVVYNNMWQFSCHVDVLHTYSEQIKKSYAIISRQENLYNLYLPDDKLLIECDRDVMTLGFTNPLSSASSGKSIVLTVAGGVSQST